MSKVIYSNLFLNDKIIMELFHNEIENFIRYSPCEIEYNFDIPLIMEPHEIKDIGEEIQLMVNGIISNLYKGLFLNVKFLYTNSKEVYEEITKSRKNMVIPIIIVTKTPFEDRYKKYKRSFTNIQPISDISIDAIFGGYYKLNDKMVTIPMEIKR